MSQQAPREAHPPEAQAPETIESRNPATGALLGSVQATPPGRIDEIVRAVAQVQPLWALLRVEDRARYMRRMAQAIIDELDALARAIGREQGRPRAEVAALELLPAIDALIWIADDGAKVLGGRRVGIHRSMSLARRARIAYEPYGVIGVIGAGSAPFAQPLGQIAGALLAGNGVVFKPAARACLTAERIARVLARADLPEGLVALAHGDAQVGVALAGAPVAKVLFTGSPAVGREVARACVSREKEVTVELGGKDAMLVLGRLPHRARGRRRAVGGVRGRGPGARGGRARVRRARGLRALHRSGSSPARGRSPSATPSGRARRSARSPRGGGWSTSSELVEEAVAQGATLHCGGPVSPEGCDGAFYAPAVITGVTPEMRLMREPIDGPVLAVTTVDSVEQAIRAGQRRRVLPRRVGVDARPLPGPADRPRAARGDGVAQRPPAEPGGLARAVGRSGRRRPRPRARRGRACGRARRRS